MQDKDLAMLRTLSVEDLIKMILNQSQMISNQNQELAKQNKQIADQNKQISDLQNRIAILEEMQRLARIEKYKPKCEQIETLFDEAEIIDAFSEPEEETVTIKEHKRKKKGPRICAQAACDTPVYTVDHTKDAPSFIERNGIKYLRTEDRIIDKIASVPAKIIVERNIYAQYKAECEGEKNIVLFENQETQALACSPSFVANIALSKYDDHLPLYRQSEMLERSNIKLGRQTMAKWLITFYGQLTALEKYFTKQMYKMKFLNMDETPLKVLDFRTEGGKISNTSYMFIRQGSSFDDKTKTIRKLVSCSYIQSRSKESLIDDYTLNDCTSYVMTDGLKAYNQFDKHCCCWVHAVRDFKKIIRDRDEKNAKTVVLLVTDLYKIENKYRAQLLNGEIDSQTFLDKRKEESLIVIDKIYAFLESLQGKYPKGAMDNAITYILERKDTLPNYLECIEATPDNNASERIAKAFATSGKNWLFSKTVDGADASCFMYSIIESAKVNNINPLDYLELVFTFGPVAKTDQDFEALLPWNADLSRLSHIKEARSNASVDESRTMPYTFTGLGRC